MALIKDINIVCSTLKASLRLLDEPLVTYSLRPKFLATAEQVNRGPQRSRYQVTILLQRLPIQNRDTLAFILLHLKVNHHIPSKYCLLNA